MSEEEEEEIDLPPSKTKEELVSEFLSACKEGNEEIVRQMLVKEDIKADDFAEMQQKNTKKWGPLIWSICKGNYDITSLLLEYAFGERFHKKKESEEGSNLGQAGAQARSTPLHWASFKGQLKTLCDLIQFHQFDPSEREENGNTALHLAATGMPSSGDGKIFLKVMEVLISEGVDLSATNSYGNTAYDLCTNEAAKALLRKVMTAENKNDDTGKVTYGLDILSIDKIRKNSQLLKQLVEKVERDMLTEDLEGLSKVIDSTRKSCAFGKSIEHAEAVLKKLTSKQQVEEHMQLLEYKRPLTRNSTAQPLQDAIANAKHLGVKESQLDSALQLIDAVKAEIKLNNILRSCEAIRCASQSEKGQRNALESALLSVKKYEGQAEFVSKAQKVLRRMDAEIELCACKTMKFQLAEEECEGKHELTIQILTLEPQVERLQNALKEATSNDIGVNKELIEELTKKMNAMNEEFEELKQKDKERIIAEEEAALKKAKKKSKKK